MVGFRFASPDHARQALLALDRQLGARADVASRTSVSLGASRYIRYSGPTTSGLAWASNVWIFSAEAGDTAQLALLIRASRAGGLSDGAGRSILPVLGWVILGIFLIGLALIAWLLTAIARGIARPPITGAPVLPGSSLQARLLALNDPAKPYLVRPGPEADLVVECKVADESWREGFAMAGIRETYRMRLYFDDIGHRVGALDEFAKVDWSAGGTATPRLRFRSSFFSGVILFRRTRGVVYDFWRPGSSAIGKVVDGEFDIEAVRQLVIDVVTGAGWTYQPILWPRRHGARSGAD